MNFISILIVFIRISTGVAVGFLKVTDEKKNKVNFYFGTRYVFFGSFLVSSSFSELLELSELLASLGFSGTLGTVRDKIKLNVYILPGIQK